MGVVEPHQHTLGQAAGVSARIVFGMNAVATGEQPVHIVQAASRRPSTRTIVRTRLARSSCKVLSAACINGCNALVSCVLPSKSRSTTISS